MPHFLYTKNPAIVAGLKRALAMNVEIKTPFDIIELRPGSCKLRIKRRTSKWMT